MSDFERGWRAAHQNLAIRIVEVAETFPVDLPPVVWDGLKEIWESMATPPRQIAGDGGYHGARSTDPATSKDAVRNRPINWDTQRGIALRIHYENPQGLNDWEVANLSDGKIPRDSNWKRIGELRTEYDPPLIAPVLDAQGNEVKRRGRGKNERTVYAITEAGCEAYRAMASRVQDKAPRI